MEMKSSARGVAKLPEMTYSYMETQGTSLARREPGLHYQQGGAGDRTRAKNMRKSRRGS